MAIPGTNPKMVYGAVVLWLPRKFAKWDVQKSRQTVITKGNTYIQTASYPLRWMVKGTTAPWHPTTENWMTGAGTYTDWLLAWNYVWENYTSKGEPFTLYKDGSYSGAADGLHRFDRCVWTGKDHGLNPLTGWERYTLDIEFETEGASR